MKSLIQELGAVTSEMLEKLNKRIAELERELAEARLDTERLDWLIEHATEIQYYIPHGMKRGSWMMPKIKRELRAAIDKVRYEPEMDRARLLRR